jgi:ribonuclease R
MSKKNFKKKKSPDTKLKDRLKNLVLNVFEKHPDVSFDYKEMSKALLVNDSETRKLIISVLYSLKDEGYLNEFSRGKFALNYMASSLEGILDVTSHGTGYVMVDDADQKDIIVRPENLNHALNGDKVRVEIIKRKAGKAEGRIVEIIERKTKEFVGVVLTNEKYAFLKTDNVKINIDIYIPLEKLNGAKDGDKVLGRITSWPTDAKSPFGEVIEVLGRPGNNDAEMISILIKNDLDYKFPQEVVEEAEGVSMQLDPKEIEKRRDMRDVLTFTIDPYDAKDFDDALSMKHLDNGHLEIGVHIADVSHYVRPGTAMDKEASQRGNSVYLVDRVVPMLPEQLSNLACSLRPNEDKYTFSAVFEIDDAGKIHNEWFGRTVTHSDRRFTYEEAQEIIEGAEGDHKDDLLTLDRLAKLYRKNRLKQGAMNIESSEIRFRLDENGEPVEVVEKRSKDAHKLIEEFMLLANKRVAIFIGKQKGNTSSENCVYRVHDKPDLAKIETFKLFVNKFGYNLKFAGVEGVATKINELFDEVKDTPQYSLIQSMAIRSMAKAAYDTVNIGHFGLSFDFYTHFTSPIRRYADLVVHRLLQDKLDGKNTSYGNLKEVCKHISAQERKAIEAERESNKYFQVKFMAEHVGEIFDGTVSGLAEFGLFVRIDENHCEGLVLMQALPGDNYYFDTERFCIVGRRKGEEYNFGDKVKVQVVGVDTYKKQIELEIYEF